MTINEMASSVRNRVNDGLSGSITNQAYSIDQLYDEIDLQRADFVHKYAGTKKLNHKFLLQTIDALEIVCRDLSKECGLECGDAVPSVKVPQLLATFNDMSIDYLGLVNKQEDFKVYFSTQDIQNHKYRKRTSHKPYAWVDTTVDENNMITIYFFNMDKYNALEYVSIRGMFEHPTWVSKVDPQFDSKEYPAPAHMQNAIVDALTEKYIRYYRQLNVPAQAVPNTQSDNIT